MLSVYALVILIISMVIVALVFVITIYILVNLWNKRQQEKTMRILYDYDSTVTQQTIEQANLSIKDYISEEQRAIIGDIMRKYSHVPLLKLLGNPHDRLKLFKALTYPDQFRRHREN